MSGLKSVVSLTHTVVKTGAEIGAAVAARVVDEVRERVAPTRAQTVDTPPRPAPAPAAAPPEPEVDLTPQVDVYDVTPPEPLVEEPTPVVPDELVAESADDGADPDGPGAAITVEEPWDGYDEMTVKAIQDRLVVADAATLTQIRLYEAAHKSRKTLLAEVDKRLA